MAGVGARRHAACTKTESMLLGRGSCWLVISCGLVAQLGCTDDEPSGPKEPAERPVLLADLPELSISMSFGPSNTSSTFQRKLAVDIDYDLGPGALQDPETGTYFCPRLHPSFATDLSGVRASTISAGGWIPMTGNFKCLPPRVWFELPPDLSLPDAQLAFGDDSLPLAVPFGDLLLERTAQPAGTTGWSFQAGQQVTLAWSPAADLARLPDARVEFWPPSPTGERLFLITQVVRGTDTISFTLPNVTGHGTFRIVLSDSRPRSCGDRCTIRSVAQAVYHDATIAP